MSALKVHRESEISQSPVSPMSTEDKTLKEYGEYLWRTGGKIPSKTLHSTLASLHVLEINKFL